MVRPAARWRTNSHVRCNRIATAHDALASARERDPVRKPAGRPAPFADRPRREWAFVELLNAYRGELGLAPVTLNSALGAAAEYHSADMAANNYFSHYLFDGTDAGQNIQNFGYTAFPYAENIAAGMATAQEVLVGWQNSPEHNATMTDPQYTEVGIGRAYNEASQYGWYWTATYGAGQGPQTVSEPLPAPVAVTDPALVTETTLPETVNSVIEAPTVITNDSGAVDIQLATDSGGSNPRRDNNHGRRDKQG
jgi:uncharacterized protein YkwD